MADEVKLEDLLDSVADAVSALVLFASDVNTDKKKLTNLQQGIKVVQQATSFLTAEAGRTIKLWHEFHYERTFAANIRAFCLLRGLKSDNYWKTLFGGQFKDDFYASSETSLSNDIGNA
jgi:hypothetical protein